MVDRGTKTASVGGQKQLLSIRGGIGKYGGGLTYSGVYWLEDNKPTGYLGFKEEIHEN